MTAASRIQEADRQARWKLRKEQGTDKPRKSQWVVTSFKDNLRPEDVAVANHLAFLWALAEGNHEMAERVDGIAWNDRHAAVMVDAVRELAGYDQMLRVRLNSAAAQCMWAVAESECTATTARRMKFHPRSKGAVRKILQLTLMTCAEYKEENEASAKKWNEAA